MNDNPLSDSNSNSGHETRSGKTVAFAKQDGISELGTTSLSPKLTSQQGVNDVVGSKNDVSKLPPSSHSQETNPRTPRKATRFFAKDTPRKERMQESKDYRSSYADGQRIKPLEFLGWECYSDTMEYFLDHVLPPLHSDLKVDDILDRCIAKQLLVYKKRSKSYRWEELTKKISNKGLHETKTYNGSLKKIFDEIAEIAEGNSTTSLIRRTYFHADGNRRTWSEKNIDIKPDAHIFMLTPDNGYPEKGNWYNAICTFQFKKVKEKTKTYENLEQVIHSLQQCLFFDPYRRFKLGVTIEGTSMRIWILSRSFLIASESLDFNANPRYFIKVALSLMFSDKVELGMDPTIEDSYDGEKRIYNIKVSGELFFSSTADIVTDVEAEGLYSTGTRIFRVYKESDKEKKSPMLLKDYWPAVVYDTEDVIHSKILASITDSTERGLVEKALLTPDTFEIVKVGGCEDSTEEVLLRKKSPTKIYKFEVPKDKGGRKRNVRGFLSKGVPISIGGRSRKGPKGPTTSGSSSICHRRHCRILYKEDAIPYHELQNIRDMLLVLEHSIDALRIIHQAGWVHRDLTPMNLYLYVDPESNAKRGIIGDLELAKKIGTGANSDFRTSSARFVSIEIVDRRYQFMDVMKTDSHNRTNGIFANYLHDLESIFWIIIWTMSNYQKDTIEGADPYLIHMQREIDELLFSQENGTNSNRIHFLNSVSDFETILNLIPSYYDDLKRLAKSFREHLFQAYYKEEKDIKEDEPIKPLDGSVHQSILETFKNTKIDGYCVTPDDCAELEFTPTEPPHSLKRSTSNEDRDEKLVKKAKLNSVPST